MAPTLYCVRHAQGFHNVTVANHNMHDPLLTPLGEEQCQILQKEFPYSDKIDLIVASPLRRTIQTALFSFGDVIKSKGLTIIALPEVQETSDLPCDTGSSPEDLQREFEGKPIDFGLVKPGWNSKRLRWAPTSQAITKRAADARQWLMGRPEKNIVVVTHGGFLHYFTEDWEESRRFAGTGWANTEYRSFTFTDHDQTAAHLVEEPESRQSRKGEEQALDKEEHVNLTRTVSQEQRKHDQEHEAARQETMMAQQTPQIKAQV